MQQPFETGAAPAPSPPGRSAGRGVVAVRFGLLLLIAGAAIAAAISTRTGPAESANTPRYVCPMHHEITAAAPGECPVCGMALVPMARESASSAADRELVAQDHTVSVMPESAEHKRLDAIDLVRKRVFSQELAAPASVEADGTITAMLYRDEFATLHSRGDATSFTTVGATPNSFAVKLSAAPPSAWDKATVRARFELGPDARRPSPGVVGVIAARLKPHEALVVPDIAVLNREGGAYVFVASQDETRFELRPIEIGRSQNGITIVTSGLKPGERVAAARAFFVDAERQLRVATTTSTAPAHHGGASTGPTSGAP